MNRRKSSRFGSPSGHGQAQSISPRAPSLREPQKSEPEQVPMLMDAVHCCNGQCCEAIHPPRMQRTATATTVLEKRIATANRKPISLFENKKQETCKQAFWFLGSHANRHRFISNLGKAGVSPKLAQTLARHSDPKLTMNIYTHVEMTDQAAAVSRLGAPPSVDVLAALEDGPSSGIGVAQELEHRFDGDECVAQGVAQTSGFGVQNRGTR